MPTLEQIQLKIAKLQAQAEAIATKKATVVLNQIAALMRKHGLTTEHIETHLATRKPRGRPAKAATQASAAAPKKRGRPAKADSMARKSKLPPKYRHPETGETWSGHARPPAWIKDVADRSIYLIAGAATRASSTTKKTRASKTAAPKGVAKKTGTRGAGRAAANGAAKKVTARKTRRSPAEKQTQAAEARAE
ncbi:H-NS family nucleoid-associated regulatory protein [Pararobbsia silviterrae]|uniref:H-NS histone family protein n=1 Tax=Pararobbsia silviterrae TaxID=1792498 RepID=A0A494Y0A0_9BURK|nr:H-NS histone family protein [Pararobbsia silviterrae]RKP55679.1 H-NS histone family protein [Pararobbsia silviterrae]